MNKIYPINLRFANAYIIDTQDGLILVDAGMPGDEKQIISQIKALGGNDLKLIFITHAHLDHYGSAAAMKRISGAQVAIHEYDFDSMANGKTELGETRGRGRLTKMILPLMLPLIPAEGLQADIVVKDQEELHDYGLNASVIHTPGHTAGSSCLFLENHHIFVGDLISTKGSPHIQRYYASDWSQIPLSLSRIEGLQPERIYPGHGQKSLTRSELNNLFTKSI